VPKREPTKDPEIFKIGESFYFRGSVGGERLEEKLEGATSYSLAVEAKRELIQEVSETGVAARRMRAGVAMTKYEAHRADELAAGDIRARTHKETADLLRLHLRPYFGAHRLNEIEEAWPGYKKSKSSIDLMNHRKVLSHFMSFCKTKKWVRYVPDFPYVAPERAEPVNLTDDEIAMLLTEAMSRRGHLPTIIVIAVTMGMRVSEISQLTWDRVDLVSRVIYLGKKDTKTKKARAMPMNDKVWERLSAMKAEATSRYVFPNKRRAVDKAGKAIDRPMRTDGHSDQFERIRAASECRRHFTIHDLRASIEARAHVDNRFTDTQREKMFGSSAKVQKEHYVRLEAEQLRGLESLLNAKLTEKINWGKAGEKAKKKSKAKVRSV
jgi:integrase